MRWHRGGLVILMSKTEKMNCRNDSYMTAAMNLGLLVLTVGKKTNSTNLVKIKDMKNKLLHFTLARADHHTSANLFKSRLPMAKALQ